VSLDRQQADAAYLAWSEAVSDGLSRTGTEGASIEPLYVDEHTDGLPLSGQPGVAPFVRGASTKAGWLHCQRYGASDVDGISDSVRRDVSAGTDGVWLAFDRASRLGRGPDDPTFGDDVLCGGLALEGAAPLRAVVAARPKALILDAGAHALPMAATALAAFRDEAIDATELALFWGADPLGALASDGEIGMSLARAESEMAVLAKHCDEHFPRARSVMVSTVAHHEAGAHAALELGYAAATVVEYLRALSREGMSLAAAASQIALCFAMGSDVFTEVSKLRAARLLWSKVLEACDISPLPAPFSFAVTSPRTLTRRDPYNNLLRGTVQTFAAIVGGADAIATTPFDAALGQPGSLGRRMAKNTQIVLGLESHLGEVLDAAGGSHYVERLTHELARAAWGHLQSIERAGGMRQHVQSGRLFTELEEAWQARDRTLSRRKLAITGVSQFAAVDESMLERAPRRSTPLVDAATGRARKRDDAWRESGIPAAAEGGLEALITLASQGAPPWVLRGVLGRDGASEKSKALPRHRDAERFEALRDRADSLGGGDARPAVMLVKLGPAAEHAAREAFASGFFASGGFRCIGSAAADSPGAAAAHAEAFSASGARIVCICGADSRYAAEASGVARALSKAGATRVLLAGRPGDQEQAFREAGIAGFIHLGTNVPEVLSELLDVVAAAPQGSSRGGK